MKNDLVNGCKNEILLKWEDKAWAHSVVLETAMGCLSVTAKYDGFYERLEQSITWSNQNLEEVEQEALLIGFCGLGVNYDALLLTDTDLVVLCNSDTREYLGDMSHEKFWQFLATFPNHYRFLKESKTGAHLHWLKKS